MDFIYNFFSSILNVESKGIQNFTQGFVYHSTFLACYFFGRFTLQRVISKNDVKIQNETVSRICSSLSQFFIIHQLVTQGCETSIHAFLSYLMNDMFFSFVFHEPLQKIIYVHHIVSVCISLVGLRVFYGKPIESFDYKNCFIISASLLCMEISAPLLSVLWILKKEPLLLPYKNKLLILVYPLLFISYVVFRLILPQYLFVYLIIIPWYEEQFFYSLVISCILCLSCMQVFWFLKFFK
jgi:hypothetical protein